jgi:hypothetical protein
MNQPSSPPSRSAQDTSRSQDEAPRATPDSMEADPAMQGEGNRTAARRYNEETQDFVQSGKVDEAARQARPGSAEEARDLQRAEGEGRSHAREEDPLLHQRSRPGGERSQ